MKLFSIYLILGFILLGSLTANSQSITINNGKAETPNEYYLQVKQFSEFIDRFNYKTDWRGNAISDSFAEEHSRKSYLNYLIDANDERLNNQTDSSYQELCSAFINDVVKPEASLSIILFSKQVKAKALVNATYLGLPQNLTIYFTPEVLDDRSGKWVINKVETNCFMNMADSLKNYFISPNSHETSFINLKRMENLSNPIFFMPTTTCNDTTLLFMTEITSERLSIKNIEKVIYLITLGDWQISVEEFIRTGYNSGWLISNVSKL